MAQEIKKAEPVGGVFDPFGDMRAEMDRMFESMFGRGGTGLSTARPTLLSRAAMQTPSVDIKETDTALVLTAELPGLAEKDVNITVRDGLLTLKGEKKSEHDETKENVHISERRYGSFQRAFRLPETIDEEKISAHFDQGVLTVTMPKGANAKPEKKIEIGRA